MSTIFRDAPAVVEVSDEEVKAEIVALVESEGPMWPIEISEELHVDLLYILKFINELMAENRLRGRLY